MHLAMCRYFFMTQIGPPAIYYGEEIGMRYVDGVAPTFKTCSSGSLAQYSASSLGAFVVCFSGVD